MAASSLQSMCQYWKNFDLPKLQKELDSTATDLVNRQDESDSSRKRLVEQSRDFKKCTPEDITKIVAPLLKSFQVEIDSLSKRSKAAEAAFLAVYTKLIDLPDPVTSLNSAILMQKRAQKVQDLELENKGLRETLDEYNQEFAEVKNQEVTIKQLKEKLKDYEDRLETTAENRAKEKERELQRQFAEKERKLQESQLIVARQLGEAEQRVSTLKTGLDSAQSELFELKAKHDEATSAKSDELEMVMADLERANERASTAEREIESLHQRLVMATQTLTQAENMQQTPDMEQALDILKRSSLEVELAAKEKQIAQLVEDVQRLQASLSKQRETSQSQISRLEEELTCKNQLFQSLEEKIKSQEDYEEIKRELCVLKSIEFPSSQESAAKVSGAKSLEMLLLEKNKGLQVETTQLKMNNAELTESESPALSASAEAFASMLGEELVSTYRQQNHSKPATPFTLHTPAPTPTPSETTNGSTADSEQPSPKVKSRKLSSNSNTSITTPVTPIPTSPSLHYSMNGHLPLSPTPFYTSPVSRHSQKQPRHHKHDECVTDIVSQLFITNNKYQEALSSGSSHLLDTVAVAKMVRELLSIHNLGQRLFAKHVLGLSQGTVSELLSKPKSWDKLTEKGRESYRKMYTWASDERYIMALKEISPKKGSQPLMATVKREDAETEDKIAQILFDAQQAMQYKRPEQDGVTAALYGHGIYAAEYYKMTQEKLAMSCSTTPPLPSPLPAIEYVHQHNSSSVTTKRRASEDKHEKHREKSGSGARHKKNRTHSDSTHSRNYIHKETERSLSQDSGAIVNAIGQSEASPQEMVSRIYREELTKLAVAAEKAGNIAACSMYQQELSRLAQSVHLQQKHEHHHHHEAEDRDNLRAIDLSQDSMMPVKQRDIGNVTNDRLHVKAEPPDSTTTDLLQTEEGPQDLSKHSSRKHDTESSCTNNNTNNNNTNNNNNKNNNNDTSTADSNIHALSSPSSLSSSTAENGHHAGSAFMLVRPRVNGQVAYTDISMKQEDSSIGVCDDQQQQIPPSPNYIPSHVQPSDCISPLQRMQNIANSLTTRGDNLNAVSNKPLRAVLPPISQDEFDKYSNVNTEDLVKKIKEMLSQYSISQRLFGENVLGLSQGSVSDLLARPKPWHMLTQKGREPFIRMHIFLEDAESIPKLVASQYRIPHDKLIRSNSIPQGDKPTATAETDNTTECSVNDESRANSPVSPPSRPSSSPALRNGCLSMPSTPIPVPPLPVVHTPEQQLSPPAIGYYQDPSALAAYGAYSSYYAFYSNYIFEIAAMTHELDTVDVTTRVKDVLQFHNLGQRLFGEAVLGLSQGSVSELLSKPKPWHMLSIKGREPFVRMQLWLNDPYSVDKLKEYQNEVKVSRRRKSYDERSGNEAPTKRPRVFFSEEQKDSLRDAYNRDPYPAPGTIEGLAAELNVGVKTVVNWFHNHRMRAKQQHPSGGDDGALAGKSGDEDASSTVKSDLGDNDDTSSQSGDNLSITDDISSYPATERAVIASDRRPVSGELQNGSTSGSQWMFPQFEPVEKSPVRREKHNSAASHSDGGGGVFDFSDEASSEHRVVKSEMKVEQENEDEMGYNSAGGQGDDSTLNNDTTTPHAALSSAGVKKRKSSHPQRIYDDTEGTQVTSKKHKKKRIKENGGLSPHNKSESHTSKLKHSIGDSARNPDHTLQSLDNSNSYDDASLSDRKTDNKDLVRIDSHTVDSYHEDIRDIKTQINDIGHLPNNIENERTDNGSISNDESVDDDARLPSSALYDRAVKIEKLKKGVTLTHDAWDEMNREESIEKLQKNIAEIRDKLEDWEF